VVAKLVCAEKEFKTLEFFTKNAERTISRDELLDEVWGYENYPCTRTVDKHLLSCDKNWRATLRARHIFSRYTSLGISLCLNDCVAYILCYLTWKLTPEDSHEGNRVTGVKSMTRL